MPKTIKDLEQLGYVVGIASGSVETEQAALDDATRSADAQVIATDVSTVTAATLQDIALTGKLPDTPEERLNLATQIAAQALEHLTTRAADRVDFHERALAIAQGMPNTWAIRHVVNDETVAQLYVHAKDDGTGWDDAAQAQIDALAEPDAFAERIFQQENPEAMQAASQLAADGTAVERDLGADTFTVDGKPTTPDQLVALVDAGPKERKT